MLREEVLREWGSCKKVLTELKDFIISENLLSTQADFGNHYNTKLVWINDSANTLPLIKLTELPNLKQLRLIYSPTKQPSLTSLTLKNCSNRFLKPDYSCLWAKSKYFSKVKNLTLHYLPQQSFPEKIIDFSAYTSLENLTIEIAHGWEAYEEIIFSAPNLKRLDWKGGLNITQIKGLEQCKRLEIVRIKDATVSQELGKLLKNHPRYQWACQNLGEDSWEWVVKKDERDSPSNDYDDGEAGPTIEEVD